ncbi:hypothetical protein [Cypionkella sinensis]
MTQAWRIMAGVLGRLNLWIAALLLLGLLQDPQVALQSRQAPQFSVQHVNLLAVTPKFALAKLVSTEARARLIPLLDLAQAASPVPPSGFYLLRQRLLAPAQSLWPSHGWQARAPPPLPATALI